MLQNQDCLLADLITAAVTSEGAVTGSRRLFSEHLDSIGLSHDYYLDSFTRPQQHKIMCAFALAMRQARFSQQEQSEVPSRMYARTSGTVANSIQRWGAVQTLRRPRNSPSRPIRDSIGSGAISEACLLLCDEIKKADYEIKCKVMSQTI